MLGLFDRPADERALEALLKAPAIYGLTESLTDLSPTELRTVLARLRRARLLTGEDPHNPVHLDAHPLVREYFGEQPAKAWTDVDVIPIAADITTEEGRELVLAACPTPDILVNNAGGPRPAIFGM